MQVCSAAVFSYFYEHICSPESEHLHARSKAALQERRPLRSARLSGVRAQLLVIEVPQPTNAQHRVRHRCGSSIGAA
eukprot:3370297-Prymnesium_polylepis.1